jgi:hypothetical protein
MNRLLDIPLKLLLFRGYYCQAVGSNPAYARQLSANMQYSPQSNPYFTIRNRTEYRWPNAGKFQEEFAPYHQIISSPSKEELEDLKLISKLFGGKRLGIGTDRRHLTLLGVPPNRPMKYAPKGCHDLYGTLYSGPASFYRVQVPHGVKYWGLAGPEAQNLPWREIKRKIKNMLVIDEFLRTYPWPGHHAMAIFFMNGPAKKTMLELLNSKEPLTADGMNVVVTLEFLDNYENTVNALNAALRKEAKRKKRTARIRAITGGIALLAFSFVAPVALAAGASAVIGAVDARSQVKMAKSMVEAAKQFEASDAAFSANLKQVAKLMEAEAARQAEMEQVEVIPEDEDEPTPSKVPLLIAGTLAAILLR